MQMQSNDLLSPMPTAPFPGENYKQLVQKVSKFASPQWALWTSYHSIDSTCRHNCPGSSFASLFGKLADSIEGLYLQSFVS